MNKGNYEINANYINMNEWHIIFIFIYIFIFVVKKFFYFLIVSSMVKSNSIYVYIKMQLIKYIIIYISEYLLYLYLVYNYTILDNTK